MEVEIRLIESCTRFPKCAPLTQLQARTVHNPAATQRLLGAYITAPTILVVISGGEAGEADSRTIQVDLGRTAIGGSPVLGQLHL